MQRLRFSLRGLLAAVVVVGFGFWLAMPFQPSVRFTTERADGNRLITRMTNEGVSSIWYPGRSTRATTITYRMIRSKGPDTWFSEKVKPIVWQRLRVGHSAIIETRMDSDYVAIIVGTEVSDWRGRLAEVWSDQVLFSELDE